MRITRHTAQLTPAPSVVPLFRVPTRSDLHTDLRLISSRSGVLERHVRVSLFRHARFCESFFVVLTRKVSTPAPPVALFEVLYFQRQSGRPQKRNRKRRSERKPRAFVRVACVRVPVRVTGSETAYAERQRTTFPSISSFVTFVLLLLLP